MDGSPDRLVADGHDAIAKAPRQAFPDVEYWVSEWHLRHAVERIKQKQHGNTRIMRALRTSMTNRWYWEHFVDVADIYGGPRVNRWVRDNEQLVRAQLRRKPDERERPRTRSTRSTQSKSRKTPVSRSRKPSDA